MDNEESNILMIKSLIMSENLIERVNYLKISGNKAYKLGSSRWNDAIIYYNQALELNCGDSTMESLIYSNRAQIQLAKKEYIYCLLDCRKSLELNPNHIKSYYRAAKASKALNKLKEAKSFCIKGLKQKHGNEKYYSLLEYLKKDIKNASRKSEKDQKNKKKTYKKIIKALALNICNLLNNLFKIESCYYPCKIWINEKFNMFFPILLLYPEHGQFDFIKSCEQHSRFADHLCQMFPPYVSSPQWDREKKYQTHNLLIYRGRKNKRFTNIDPRKSFNDILKIENYQISEMPVFYIIHPDFLKLFQNRLKHG